MSSGIVHLDHRLDQEGREAFFLDCLTSRWSTPLLKAGSWLNWIHYVTPPKGLGSYQHICGNPTSRNCWLHNVDGTPWTQLASCHLFVVKFPLALGSAGEKIKSGVKTTNQDEEFGDKLCNFRLLGFNYFQEY